MATKAVSSTTAPLTTKQAAAAIVELINARPTSPRPDEIEPIIARAVAPVATSFSDAQNRLFAAVQECLAAEKALGNATRDHLDVDHPDRWEAADAHYVAALERVGELAEQLAADRSIANIVVRALVAYCHADRTDGVLDDLADDADGTDDAANARLIEAVMQFAGIRYE